MYCTKCGNHDEAGGRFCTICGAALVIERDAIEQPDQGGVTSPEPSPLTPLSDSPSASAKPPMQQPSRNVWLVAGVAVAVLFIAAVVWGALFKPMSESAYLAELDRLTWEIGLGYMEGLEAIDTQMRSGRDEPVAPADLDRFRTDISAAVDRTVIAADDAWQIRPPRALRSSHEKVLAVVAAAEQYAIDFEAEIAVWPEGITYAEAWDRIRAQLERYSTTFAQVEPTISELRRELNLPAVEEIYAETSTNF